MVEIKNLSLHYTLSRKRNIPALKELNVRFQRGEISVIIGPSGCGKTSLIKIIAGLVTPSGGELIVDGIPVRGIRKNTAVIFQDYGLLPWKTVRANAELPFALGARQGKNERKKADALLTQFGLMDFTKLYPNELSGGMKQRLAIVRALVMAPELILMDEPFSSLDALSREEAQDFFLSVKKDIQPSIVLVSHSIEEAVYLADTVYVMKGKNPGTMTEGVSIIRQKLSHAEFRETPGFQEYCGALRKDLQEG